MQLTHMPLNPHYGQGQFTRAILIRNLSAQEVELGMEDHEHALRIYLKHDGENILTVSGQWIRHPMDICAGAAQALSSWNGSPLLKDLRQSRRTQDTAHHCTHFIDMLDLASVHAYQQRPEVHYAVVVDDSPEGDEAPQLWRNKQKILSLQLEQHEVFVEPHHWRGRSVYKGFLKWAAASLEEAEFELAYIVQKAMFVARSQRIDIPTVTGKAARLSGPPDSVCYASQPERYDTGLRLNNNRDISSTPSQILKFMDSSLAAQSDN